MKAQQENRTQGFNEDAGAKNQASRGRALIGTQGWTGPDWRRLAYPGGLSATGRLAWYASVFDAVEVNSTFYGIPSHATVRTWRGAVPRGFTFTVKMPRQVTHEPDLSRSVEELTSFLDAVSELGESLGGVLIQLPPWFGRDRLPELSGWMSRLPVSEFDFFLETRSPALHGPRLWESLEHASVGRVTTNLGDRPGEIATSTSTQSGYIRWLGPRRGFTGSRPDTETFKRDTALWAAAIQSHTDLGKDVQGFFSGDYLGTGLLPAAYLCEQLGRPVELSIRPSAVPLMRSALIDAGYPRVDPPAAPRSPSRAGNQGVLL